MSTEASACAGFFQDHANTAAINQYFQQLSSQTTAAAAASSVNSLSNNNSDSGNDGSITGRTNSTSSGDSTRSSVSSNDSNKSCRNNSAGSGGTGTGTGGNSLMTAGNGNSNTNQWLAMQQQQQQQNQQHLQQQQQQHHHQQQQQHHNQQQQQQQHHNQQQQHQQHLNQHQQQQQQHLHHQSMHQTHHNNSQHQQLQQQQQQQHQQQLQQQQQQQQQQHQQLSAALSQSLQQNLVAAGASAAAAAAAASVTTNPHSIFGTGNFHYKTNNSWSIPSLSCYQRLYNENAHYQRNFNNNNNNNGNNNNDSTNINHNANNNNTNTNSSSNSNSSTSNHNNSNPNNNNSTNNHNSSSSNNNNNNNNSNGNTNNNNNNLNCSLNFGNTNTASVSTVQHVANAVAAAVIANEHQNHLNNLKTRFLPSSSGRKSPFLGFICKTNGKSTSNSKEVICPDDKYKEEGDLWNVEAQTAFLGPNLWEKTLPYDADLKYADLDEFLSENNIPDGLPGTHLGHSSSLGHRSDSLSHAAGLSLGLGHITTKRERSPSPSDCISPDTLNPPSPAESTFSFASSGRDFDPRTRAFSDEELKPQPMIKKSRKQFVPDELKDDKYWARRRKNNIAAKRSRDARRQKENQIAMRARYLEKENATLHQEVEQLKQENMDLRARLSKFQDV